MNGLTRELFVNGWVDEDWVARAHARRRRPARDGRAVHARARRRRSAASTPTTCAGRRGSSARASACCPPCCRASTSPTRRPRPPWRCNNLHLLRGMIGRPGAGILQMNGQPTAQNNRECGADGDLPGFRNWDNPAHVAAAGRRCGTSTPMTIPHWAPPTHAMQIFSYAETGLDRAAVDLGDQPRRVDAGVGADPQDPRRRPVLRRRPGPVPHRDRRARRRRAAGRRAGARRPACFTNVNRTVHLSEKAVDPPGEARSDLDIFLMYADAMGFTDRDGAPADQVADTRGGLRRVGGGHRRPARRLHRPVLRQAARTARGIPWPVNDEHPDGTDRLYTDGVFPTDTDYCETYGHDLLTGGTVTEQEHRAMAPGRAGLPQGRAVHAGARGARRGLPAAVHHRPHRLPVPHPHQDRPLAVASTGPHPTPGSSSPPPTPTALGIAEGDWVRVESPRGAIEVRARVGRGHAGRGVRAVPLRPLGRRRRVGAHDDASTGSANELTMTVWDPVSKQPTFKTAACRVDPAARRRRPGPGADHDGLRTRRRTPHARRRPTAGTARWRTHHQHRAADDPDLRPRPRRRRIADAAPRDLRRARRPQRADPGRLLPRRRRGPRPGRPTCSTPAALLAGWSDDHRDGLAPVVERYGEADDVDEPERLHAAGLAEIRDGRDRAAARPAGPARARHPRADHLDRDRPRRPRAARPGAARGRRPLSNARDRRASSPGSTPG